MVNRNQIPKPPPNTQNQLSKIQNPPSTFLARFGQVIVRHGVAAIPAALYHYQGELQLSAQEVWFISSVLSHKWTEDMPHPNLKRMERETGVQERTLRRYKQRLCASGLLIVHPRYDESRRQDSNYYDFSPLFSQIRELIREETRQVNPISADGPGLRATPDEEDEGDDRAGPGMSFMARYGAAIVSRGIAAVPQAVFTYGGELGLTPQQSWFICYIFSVPWSPPFPYPSLIKMAARTGYSKMQLHEIKNSLVERGYLRLVHRTKSDGGQDSNGYDFAGLFEALRERLQGKSEPGKGATSLQTHPTSPVEETPSPPQRPARQGSAAARIGAARRTLHSGPEPEMGRGLTAEADNRLTRVGDNSSRWEGDSRLTGVGDYQPTGEADNRLTEVADNELTGPVKRRAATRLSRALRGRGSQGGHESEPSLETDKRSDSNQIPPAINKRERTNQQPQARRFSPYIAAIVTDFSDELGDSTHVTANVGQALRVYAQSGIEEQEFAQLLFEARKTVRARQGQQGLGTINNKMAYFFVVLRDLVRQSTADGP